MRFIHIADVHLGAVPDAGCPWSAYRAAGGELSVFGDFGNAGGVDGGES